MSRRLINKRKDKNKTEWDLEIDGRVVGRGGVRHQTTTAGDVVYRINEEERNKGYGKLILKLLINEAKKWGGLRLL